MIQAPRIITHQTTESGPMKTEFNAEAYRAELPTNQAKRRELFAPALMKNYMARFSLTERDMNIRAVGCLLKAKINTDIFAAQQNRKITMLEAKVSALLQFVAKYAKKSKHAVRNGLTQGEN